MKHLLLESSLSEKDFAISIMENLKKTLGVDLQAIFSEKDKSEKSMIKDGARMLKKAIISYGLKEGEVEYSSLINADPLSAESGIDIEPNFAISEKDANYLANLQGEEVKKYLFNLTKRFENMSVAKSEGILVAEMAAGAVIAVGVPMGVTVYRALKAGQALRAAMMAGVRGIGMKTVIGAVAIVLVALLLFLFLENPKKVLGMVMNNTDHNLYVKDYTKSNGNLHMEHGQMVDFMEDNEDGLDSPKLQIKQRLFFGVNDSENVVFAGMYFADKNFGLRGAEGIMVFTDKSSSFAVAHTIAVPYSNDNRTYIDYLTTVPTDLPKLFREQYNKNVIRVDHQKNGYRLTSTVNDKRGGVVGCISYIQQI